MYRIYNGPETGAYIGDYFIRPKYILLWAQGPLEKQHKILIENKDKWQHPVRVNLQLPFAGE